MSFRSQLSSLERATPSYGAEAYGSYGDELYGDAYDDLSLAEPEALTGNVAPLRPVAAGAVAPGLVGAVVHDASTRTSSVPASAAVQRRAVAYRRRRQVLATLVVSSAALAAPAALLGGPWLIAVAASGTLLVTYLALLIRHGRRAVERSEKVRYLAPIRAPRPAVVILGSGTAR